MVLGFDLALSTFVFGAITGLTYAVFAAGFVLVYRSTGVLNFAQGEIGSFAILLMALLKLQYGVPYWFAFVLTTLACAVIGLVVELPTFGLPFWRRVWGCSSRPLVSAKPF